MQKKPVKIPLYMRCTRVYLCNYVYIYKWIHKEEFAYTHTYTCILMHINDAYFSYANLISDSQQLTTLNDPVGQQRAKWRRRSASSMQRTRLKVQRQDLHANLQHATVIAICCCCCLCKSFARITTYRPYTHTHTLHIWICMYACKSTCSL